PALRAACLDTKRQALAALVPQMTRVDARAMYSIPTAITELPPLDDCAAERLVDRPPLPHAPDVRAPLIAPHPHYALPPVQPPPGTPRAKTDELVAMADAADALGYEPLVGEALDFAGRVENALNERRAVPILRRAVLASLSAADDRQAGSAAVDLYSGLVHT